MLQGYIRAEIVPTGTGTDTGPQSVQSHLLPSRVRETRLRLGVTPDELAQRLGVTPSAARKLDSSDLKATTLYRVAEALGVRPSDLIHDVAEAR